MENQSLASCQKTLFLYIGEGWLWYAIRSGNKFLSVGKRCFLEGMSPAKALEEAIYGKCEDGKSNPFSEDFDFVKCCVETPRYVLTPCPGDEEPLLTKKEIVGTFWPNESLRASVYKIEGMDCCVTTALSTEAFTFLTRTFPGISIVSSSGIAIESLINRTPADGSLKALLCISDSCRKLSYACVSEDRLWLAGGADITTIDDAVYFATAIKDNATKSCRNPITVFVSAKAELFATLRDKLSSLDPDITCVPMIVPFSTGLLPAGTPKSAEMPPIFKLMLQ